MTKFYSYVFSGLLVVLGLTAGSTFAMQAGQDGAAGAIVVAGAAPAGDQVAAVNQPVVQGANANTGVKARIRLRLGKMSAWLKGAKAATLQAMIKAKAAVLEAIVIKWADLKNLAAHDREAIKNLTTTEKALLVFAAAGSFISVGLYYGIGAYLGVSLKKASFVKRLAAGVAYSTIAARTTTFGHVFFMEIINDLLGGDFVMEFDRTMLGMIPPAIPGICVGRYLAQ